MKPDAWEDVATFDEPKAESWDDVATFESPKQEETWDQVASFDEEPPDQSRLSSGFNAFLGSMAKVGTGTVKGLAEMADSPFSPTGIARIAGEKTAEALTGGPDVSEQMFRPGQAIAEKVDVVDQAIDRTLPTNPAYEDEWMANKIPSVLGQAAGQLATSLVPGKFAGMGSKALTAVGLGQAGVLGLDAGYKEADRLGVTSPLKRDILATIYGATEAGTEAIGGFGTPSFSKALTGEMRNILDGGLKKFLKTATSEGLEEVGAQIPQDIASYVAAENDAPLNTIDPRKMAYWENLGEAFGLGSIAGGLFGGVEAIANRPTPKAVMAMRVAAQEHRDELMARQSAGEALSEEETASMAELDQTEQDLSKWLETQGMALPTQAKLIEASRIEDPDQKIEFLNKWTDDAVQIAGPLVSATVQENKDLGNTKTAEALETLAVQTQNQQELPQPEEKVSPTEKVPETISDEQPPLPEQPQVAPQLGAVSQESPIFPPAPEGTPTSEQVIAKAAGVAKGQIAPEVSPAVQAVIPKQNLEANFQSLTKQFPKQAKAIQKAAPVLIPAIQKWAGAFSSVEFAPIGGSGIMVQGDTLVVDAPVLSEGLESKRWTPESIGAAMNEEALHVVVDSATASMMSKEAGISPDQITQEQLREKHAQDWQSLPERVKKESERLYKYGIVENLRRKLKTDPTDPQIDEALAAFPMSDAQKGAEFKRQVLQGRIFGVLTEEAQARDDFADWLKKFLSELIASIKSISAKLTDPRTRKSLDELEARVRQELDRIQGGNEYASKISSAESVGEQPSGAQGPRGSGSEGVERRDQGQEAARTGGPNIPTDEAQTVDQIISKLDASSRVPNMRLSEFQKEVQSLVGSRVKEVAEALGTKPSIREIAVQMLMDGQQRPTQVREIEEEQSEPEDELEGLPRRKAREAILKKRERSRGKVEEGAEQGERKLTAEERLARRREALGAPEPPRKAYHGSPFSFLKFSNSEIGKGEGNQSYGYGVYVSDAKDVAKSYSPEKDGHLYEVKILPAEESFLLWDKAIPEQSDAVQDVIDKLISIEERNGKYRINIDGNYLAGDFNDMASAKRFLSYERGQWTGEKLYKKISASPKEASEKLLSLGIHGISYPDQALREGSGKTMNHVLFDGDDLEIESSGMRAPEPPPRPEVPVAFNLWEEMGAADPVVQAEALDDAWRSFWTAAKSFEKPEEQIVEEWKQELSDPESPTVFQGVVEAKRARRKTDYTPMDVDRTGVEQEPDTGQGLSAPEPPLSKEAILQSLQEDMEVFKRINKSWAEASESEREGPNQAQKDQRVDKETGEPMGQYRDVLPLELAKATAAAMLAKSFTIANVSKQEYGRMVMDYLKGGENLPGIEGNDVFDMALANQLRFNKQFRSSLGIKEEDASEATLRAIGAMGSRSGTVLQMMSQGELYSPLEDLAKVVHGESDKGLGEIGIKDPTKFSDDVNKAVEETKKPIVDEIAANPMDWFTAAMDAFKPSLQKALAQIRTKMERINAARQELLKRTAKSAAAPLGTEYSDLAVMSTEDIQAEIDKLVGEVEELVHEVLGTKKRKKKLTPEQVESTANKIIHEEEAQADRASFRDWVNGTNQEGIPSFKELMLENISGNTFDREAFAESLSQKFQSVEPELIETVTNDIGDAIEGRELEQNEAKKPDYDARAKRIVTQAIADDVQPKTKAELDEFTKAVKARLKGEITAEQFMERLEKLDVEPMTAFAMNRKVEADIARRALEAELRKKESEQRREVEKDEREAKAEVERMSRQLDDNDPEKKEGSKLRELVRAYKKFEIDDAQLREGLGQLNLSKESKKNLRKILEMNRRRQKTYQWTLIHQNAAKARDKAIKSITDSLTKTPTPKKGPKRTKFINNLIKAMEADVLSSQDVRDAFAKAYDLHGLTQERLEKLGKILRDIEMMPDGEVKGTLFEMANDILNELSPPASWLDFSLGALMGHVLAGMGTMVSQFSQTGRVINPFQGAWMAQAIMDPEGMKSAANFWKLFQNSGVYTEGIKQLWKNWRQIPAGLSGAFGGTTHGLGVSPTPLLKTIPQSLGRYKWKDLANYKVGKSKYSPKFFRTVPETKEGKIAKKWLLSPAWMASRSFAFIRAAEAYSGAIERNMMARAKIAAHLVERDKLTPKQAWNKVANAFNPVSNPEMWKKALAQANEEYKKDLIGKFQINSRAESLMQDMIDKEWGVNLRNQHREMSALKNFKADPITKVGEGVANSLKTLGDKVPAAKMIFLFPRFFVNIYEASFANFPGAGRLTISKEDAEKGAGKNPRLKRIEAMFGSLPKYRQYRKAQAAGAEAMTFAATTAMMLSYALWKYANGDDEDKKEPPVFWITGNSVSAKAFAEQNQMKEGGWWAPTTMYLRIPGTEKTLKINYVQAAPELAVTLNMIGNYADRVMFDELLTYSTDQRTRERTKDSYKSYVEPIVTSALTPTTRSTFADFQKAISRAIDGNPQSLLKLLGRPVGGALAGSVLGGPVVKDVDKYLKPVIPKAAQNKTQAFMSGIPFASQMGFDTGLPMMTALGEPVSGWSYLPFFSKSQESTPEKRRAAQILNDVGLVKEGPQEYMIGRDLVELAISGERYLLSLEEREQVLGEIGSKFSSYVVNNKDKIMRAKEESQDEARKVINSYSDKAREQVMRQWRDRVREKK